jgi:polyhydroxybutyrate depolymerase
MRVGIPAALAVATFLAAGCGDVRSGVGPSDPGDPGDPGDPAPPDLVVARPYQVHVPPDLAPGRPAALVLLLHGYGASGAQQSAYFGFADLAATRGAIVAYPDGTVDPAGRRFWNATDACCDLYASGVDDVAYLTAVLDDLERRFAVDPRRVYVVGHSNGAFMAHRLACELAPRVAGIAALAGDVWDDASRCRPAAAVAVLQVHGDRDLVVPYSGGQIAGTQGAIPSAAESVATWASLNGCTGGLTAAGERLDLDVLLAGAETRIDRFACTAAGAELWTIEGGGHIPVLRTPEWGDAILSWLEAHAR